jgi:non-homologous end joining protein Ku
MTTTSKEINLKQLDDELGSKGLIADFNDPKKKQIMPAEFSDVTEEDLAAAIAAHVAKSTQPTIEEKLQSVGLSINDLKAALGV